VVAGSGKTILSSTIIDSLIEGEKIHTVYFYCDYRDIERMSTVGLYASLTAQILQNNFAGELPERFSKYFEDNKAKLPQEVALYTELMVLIESIGRTRVVVDALDECTIEVRQDILKTLFEMQKRGKINVLVTSREENDIKYVVESFGVPNVSLQIKPSATSNDLAMFVKGEIERTDTKLSRLRESTKQEILTAITAEAKGMFRWAKCTLDYIAGLRSDKAIKKSLTELPPGLNDVYDRILEKISHADKGIAMRVFHWLTCAYRPLLIQEMVEGLGIEWGSTRLDPDSLLNNPEDLLEICGSLVEINRDTGTISLAHFTVKEYLTSHLRNGKHADYFVDVMRANFRLAKLCVTYLSFEAFGDGPCQSMREYAQRCKTNTLFRYAATFWPKHARDHENTEDRSFLSVMEYFFLDPKMHGNFESWMQAYEEAPPGREFDTYLYRDWGIENRLIYAARLGLYSTVQLLLSKGYDPSAICKPSGRNTTPSIFQGNCGNPLNSACESGNVKVMELLLSKGVDINAMAGSHGLALNAVVHSDVQRNDFTALRYLLQRGANPNLTFGEENFPLYTAAFECSSAEAVKILIEGGADLTMADKAEATMFEAAGGLGMREIFEVIWEHGGGDYPNPTWDKIFNFTRGVDGWSLFLASQSNFFESAQKILLKNGHRIFKDPSYEKLMLYTFRWCSSKGYYKFLQQMLEYSGTEGEFFKLALLDAVRKGHAMTVSTILESHKGAIPGSPGSSLVLAGASGSLNVVKDLLQRGGDPTAVDEHGWSALLAATVFKQHDILELFDNMGKRLQDNTCTPLTPSSWQIERTLLPLWELPDPKLEISGNVVYLLPG
jgi:ankyrin repeat protein